MAVPRPSRAGVAPSRLRVMVVDDSIVVRGLLRHWIAVSGAFEIAGLAENGRVALDMLDAARPDVVLLDLDMPELDGLATLPLLLARRPDLSVLIVSTATRGNAELALRCLALGAVGIMPKPATRNQITLSTGFREDLLATIAGLGPRHLAEARPAPPGPAPLRSPPAPAPAPRCVLIGASTGGPRAIADVLAGLARVSERLPILVVQHMPPIFTAAFADQLRHATGLAVHEAVEGTELRPGRVHVAPGGRHMGLGEEAGRIVIRLDDGPPVRHARPALDILMQDAARIFGSRVLAAILTGMGDDGTEGARAVGRAGGTVLVQDEPSSTIWGMPGSVARAGLARAIVPLAGMARAIQDGCGRAVR